jgi:hypothetical protein
MAGSGVNARSAQMVAVGGRAGGIGRAGQCVARSSNFF